MASSISAHRAVAVGLSGGLGIALPLAAVAVTLPLADAHEAVQAAAVPFAVGSLAGVGLFALCDLLLDRREDRLAAEAEEVASFTSVFGGADQSSSQTHATTMAEEAAARGPQKRHPHRAAPKGVPVISRAVDALDEAAAWAEIDAMLSEDSPISCDPARSKDMYEIALEELRRAEQSRSTAATDSAASAPVARPESTATFMAVAASRPAGAQPVDAPMPALSTQDLDLDEVEEATARDAAIASLYGSAPQARPATTPEPVSVLKSAASTPASVSVPVADYSGHEAMWAAALAILDEEPTASVAPSSVPSKTAFVDPERMARVAEGGSATRSHAHVNDILEEEFDRVSSSSVRRTSHEYLRVIQGGTAAMPRLRAQA